MIMSSCIHTGPLNEVAYSCGIGSPVGSSGWYGLDVGSSYLLVSPDPGKADKSVIDYAKKINAKAIDIEDNYGLSNARGITEKYSDKFVDYTAKHGILNVPKGKKKIIFDKLDPEISSISFRSNGDGLEIDDIDISRTGGFYVHKSHPKYGGVSVIDPSGHDSLAREKEYRKVLSEAEYLSGFFSLLTGKRIRVSERAKNRMRESINKSVFATDEVIVHEALGHDFQDNLGITDTEGLSTKILGTRPYSVPFLEYLNTAVTRDVLGKDVQGYSSLQPIGDSFMRKKNIRSMDAQKIINPRVREGIDSEFNKELEKEYYKQFN